MCEAGGSEVPKEGLELLNWPTWDRLDTWKST